MSWFKLPQDTSKDARPGWWVFRLPKWFVGKERMSVVEWHDKVSEAGSNAQSFIDGERQAEAFERQLWEVQGKRYTALGCFMSMVVRVTSGVFWDGPKKFIGNLKK